ncbi:transcriptional regulator, TetR family [Nocardia amikacinitolerans]|uniref:TetR/AcrR family transcriptional regulator n=1 Tax=Nocardia amikacinitolerans TaxID=756689 RepID=UPI00082D32D4|nr:TetR/AcrR family transcriptional regulator [Nocardia amikacinitolerans]MCP2316901.1 transcriptional regulator, TetR family [Nocardia amikacinitolerans]
MTLGKAGTKGVPRERREQQILDIATVEFGDRGYAKASVADIAAAAGVSKPLIYNYFESRDGLHAACVRRAGDGLVAAVSAAQAVSGAEGKALATLAAIFTAIDGRVQNWKIIYDSTLPADGPAAELARGYQKALNAMGAEGSAQVLADAAVTDAEDHSLLLAIWFSVVSTVVAWWGEHPQHSPDEMTARCVRLFEALRAPVNPRG